MSLRAYMRKEMPQRAPSEHVSVPAPMGSINTISSGAAMTPEDCIARWNLIPAEYGLRTRLGSREWVTGLDGEVRAILPFAAQVPSSNKVFATTETGIWDVTDSAALTDTTQRVVTFGASDENAGHGVSCVMVTSAGHFLLYADDTGGLRLYTESTGLWSVPSLTGVSASSICFVTVWKNRVWLVEKNTGKGWYLDVNAVGGAATSFNFGARFLHGGELVGLWSLTYDGGAGMDDSLVAVSRGGDVLVYQGTDPASASTFGLKGVYYAGAVPAGRRICSDFGGDLLVMTTTGLMSIRQLTLGASTQYATEKIQNLWNKLMLTRSGQLGWSMVLHPLDATLIVIAPVGAAVASDQLVMSTASKSWSQYRDLGMGNCAAAHEGTLYFGTADGKVKIMDGYVDGVTLADPSSYTAIGFALLTSFQNLGTPRLKRVNLIRPTFVSDIERPTYSIEARYGWDTSEPSLPSSSTAPGANAWDVAKWDEGVWMADYFPTRNVHGSAGMGPEVAIAIKGTTACRSVLVGFDVSYDVAGLL